MTHFASTGVPLDAPGCSGSNLAYPGFYNEGGSRRGDMARESGDISPPVGSRGKNLVGVLRDEVPQKLKKNLKLVYNFYRCPVRIFRI